MKTTTLSWIKQMFDAQIVQNNGIVRRKKSDVKTYASFDDLLEYCRDEQYHLIETGNQYVVICNDGAMKLHC